MRNLPRLWPMCVVFGLALSACGEEARSAARATPVRGIAPVIDPWERIPPDSLYGATAIENLRVVPAVIDALNVPKGWNGMRIAAISDFHLGLWPDNDEVAGAAVRRALESRADLIVLLGDYVTSEQDTAALAQVIAPLRGRQVLAVLGNEDIRSDSLEAAVTRTLTRQGIRVLKNEAIPFTRNGSTGYIAGADPDLETKGFGEREFLLATLAGGARVPLLLVHNPLLLAATQEDRHAAVLAGGSFCGNVEVPGTPRLSWVRTLALPGAALGDFDRFFRMEGNTMFVTCGVGFSFMPVRLAAPPEVALITLQSVAPPTTEQSSPDSVAIPDSIMQRYQVPDSVPADTAR